ncbi:hypothetical protein HUE46_04335 [Flavobacterium columnare]|uniref:primase-helicase family protein n=1 Tax=Flavobacterium columnare TaxID=996 RepID=UPI001781E685|nr:primase-helicase family protein [Flavobacterium columnare]QOG89301.1 hypothetical protein HUE41_04335 [Flavobacterium columnare]QOG91960.1 hypothetical protein HUE42_04330 [Flavobacterium columnare]QOG94624.1 hypothetical protein HUE43_04335 [Flavobacterium columnare]QOG97283.1 hypothetical protein HUE44_04330 [Flavobacterium columnare]QOG99941.1 hypothetical protein HUE45_04330 [Flavobacterium columnare]
MENNSNSKKITFWSKSFRSNNTIYKINPSDLKRYIASINICIFAINNQTKVIQFINGIAKEITPQEVFNICLKYVETFENKVLTNAFLTQGETLILSKKAILGSLNITELLPVRDQIDKSFIFYENCFVEISPHSGLKINEYSKIDYLNGFVWEKSILKRPFSQNNEVCVFENFLRLVTNNEDHYFCIVSAIGYLLHSFKNPSLTKVVIISDENTETENKANGGTGKGMIVKSVEQFRNVASQNGKNIDLSDNRFAFQSVTLFTNVLFLDDVKKGFDFEQLFSVITSTMIVEQKHKSSFEIPFEFSPKIIISTNYQISGDSSSHNRRKYLIFLNNYFSDLYTPFMEFEHLFFTDWDKTEWNRFDTFMLSCIRKFLENGLVDYEKNKELQLKKLKQEIDPSVFELMENRFNELNRYYLLKATNLKSTKQISLYAQYKGYEFKTRINNGCTEFMLKEKK